MPVRAGRTAPGNPVKRGMMRASTPRPLGRSGVDVTVMSFGGAPIGNFLRPFTDEQARAMVDQAWGLGLRYFDTAPGYGHGLSEYRLGHALHERPRKDFVLSTKVGRVLRPSAPDASDAGPWVAAAPFAAEFDYSYDGVMRSFEDSMQRLLVNDLDIVLMHDIDEYTHGAGQGRMFDTALTSGFRALADLRDQGLVKAIGVGVNEADVCLRVVQQVDIDCVLLAGRYTLLEQEPLNDLFPACTERDIAVILGGVFNSGILATGPVPAAKFNYSPASDPVRRRAAALEAVCGRHGVPLAAAAIQFAAAHPVVSSICLGSRTLQQQANSVDWLEVDVPAALWADLRAENLIRHDAPTP